MWTTTDTCTPRSIDITLDERRPVSSTPSPPSPADPGTPGTPGMSGAPQINRRWADVRQMADLLDSRFRIPGTQQTFGVDAVLGLIPGVGDVVGLAAGGVVITNAVRLGARGWTLVQMLVNMVLDATIGSVPVAGTIFDVFYKANNRNVALLEEHVRDAQTARTQARRTVLRSITAVVVVTVVVAIVLVVGLVWLLQVLF